MAQFICVKRSWFPAGYSKAPVFLIFFEEAGSFGGLLKAWEVAMPTMRQGSKTLGTMIAFGTGGEEGVGFEMEFPSQHGPNTISI